MKPACVSARNQLKSDEPERYFFLTFVYEQGSIVYLENLLYLSMEETHIGSKKAFIETVEEAIPSLGDGMISLLQQEHRAGWREGRHREGGEKSSTTGARSCVDCSSYGFTTEKHLRVAIRRLSKVTCCRVHRASRDGCHGM